MWGVKLTYHARKGKEENGGLSENWEAKQSASNYFKLHVHKNDGFLLLEFTATT